MTILQTSNLGARYIGEIPLVQHFTFAYLNNAASPSVEAFLRQEKAIIFRRAESRTVPLALSKGQSIRSQNLPSVCRIGGY